MSGHGHGGRVGTGWKVRDSSGLVWPSMFPVRTDEMNLDRITEAATVLHGAARRVEKRTEQIATTWAGLQGCYSSPEAPAVLALMTPAQDRAEQIGEQLRRAAGAIEDYVGELRGLRGQIDDVVGQCEAFRAEVEGGVWRDAASTKQAKPLDYGKAALSWAGVDERKVLVPWDQDQGLVDRNEDLIGMYSAVVAKVTAAAGRCANTIDGLPSLTGFAAELMAGSPLAPGWSAGQIAAWWGPPATEDRSWVEQLASGVYRPVQSILAGGAALNGFDTSTGTWSFRTALAARSAQAWDQADTVLSVVATIGITAPLAMPAAGGRLTGHPEWGDWAPDWFQDRGTKSADTVAQIFGGDPSAEYVWQPWHDHPWQAGGTTAVNVATAFLPVKGLGAARGGGEASLAARAAEAAETGAMRAARNTTHPLPGLLNHADSTGPTLARTATTANPTRSVLATLDRIPDNLSRQALDTRPQPVSDDLFTNTRPRTNPEPALTTNHNPHPDPAPERARQPIAATARTAEAGPAPHEHPSQTPGRAADAITTQEIHGLPRSPQAHAHPGTDSPAAPGPDSGPPAHPGGDPPGLGRPGDGADPPTVHEDPPGSEDPAQAHHDSGTPKSPDTDDPPHATADIEHAHQPDGDGKILEPISGGEPLTQPTNPRGSSPTGLPETPHPNDNADRVRAIQRQNEAADTLARTGYLVEHQPEVLPTDRGVGPTKNPDYRIEGKIFDGFSPLPGTTVENVYLAVLKKVDRLQTTRVLVNLDDSPLTATDLHRYFTENPMPGLDEVIVVRNGSIQQIYP